MGICPKCGTEVNAVNASTVQIEVNGTQLLKGITYFCPKCSCVLGVSADPVALKSSIVSEILKSLGKS